MIEKFQLGTSSVNEFTDITEKIMDIISRSEVTEGICNVFVPHTTAGVTINENADPDVKRDILMELGKIVPFSDDYSHLEGNSAAHIKATLTGCSETLIISRGRPLLWTWQGIYFCEFDGPRERTVYVRVSS